MDQDHIDPPLKRPKFSENTHEDNTDNLPENNSYKSSGNSSGNYVSVNELESLKQFSVLDEINEDSDTENSNSDAEDEVTELPEEELDKLLDENLPDSFKVPPKPKEKTYEKHKKIVLDEKGINKFEILPQDWISVKHYSGLPVYMHRTTRVCTLSKPYALGKGSARKHDIPISALPCLAYKKALQEEEKQSKIDKEVEEQIASTNNILSMAENKELKEIITKCPIILNDKKSDILGSNQEPDNNQENVPQSKPVVLPDGTLIPPPKVESVDTSWKAKMLSPQEINDYCKNLFKFKTVDIIQFKRWSDRHKYEKTRKALQNANFPQGAKVLTVPVNQEQHGKTQKREWVLNVNGRSYLSIFHEYVRRVLQKQPNYEFRQLENSTSPYQAIVFIGGMQYGVGQGSSKREAKANAARASLDILIPELKGAFEDKKDKEDPHVSFFDQIKIEDPRVTEYCATVCEPSPHAILRTCLLRNFGVNEQHIKTDMKKLEHQRIELTMTVGKHSASVICKNKKMAKQRASQAILQLLHPSVQTWGSLIRLYGSQSIKTSKEKKLDQQEITLLQNKAKPHEPNYALLEKLRYEMKKLKERDEAVAPIGTLLVKEDLPEYSGSNLNNVDL